MGPDPTNPAAGAPDPGAGGVHDRPLEPDHPMVLEGMTAPGDVRFMAQCMVEDLLISGLAADDLRTMSRNAEYRALFGARTALGDAAMDQIIDQTSLRIGRRAYHTVESTSSVQPASLTISAARRPGT